MNFSLFLRNNLTKIPCPIGQLLSYVPFEIRPGIGKIYRRQRREICEFESLTVEQKKRHVFTLFKNIVEYAYNNVTFYKDFYSLHRFSPSLLKSFDDIERVPILNKKILQNYQIEFRSSQTEARQLVNTGGSSGNPLSFYISPDQMGNEWAHMHKVWEKLSFRASKLKISFGGDSEIKNGFRYDAVRHSLWFNIYADFSAIADELLVFLKKHKVYYLHGYPSALYEFALNCQKFPELLAILKSQLQGAFLSSEFPISLYRDAIEETFKIKTVSWYGHTERCILAYEKYKPYEYVPFQTYGYAEIERSTSDRPSLIGTSYYNFASPLIRYNTEDQVTSFIRENGVLTAFELNEGRGGQFVLDKHGKNIPLTGLIFGRHHRLFDYCSHMQISQAENGKALILYVPNDELNLICPDKLFDSKNVAIEFSFQAIKEPVRTVSGKINLFVRPEQVPGNNKIKIVE